jgi:hypothetical protein
MFELRPFFWKSKKKLNIYGDARTIRLINKRHDYLFKKGVYDIFGPGTVIADSAISILEKLLKS